MEYFTASLSQFSNKGVNTVLWVAGWVLAICSKHFRNFLEIAWFPKILIYVVWQLVRQLLYSPFGDNNLVLFHLWWTNVLFKRLKVYTNIYLRLQISFQQPETVAWSYSVKKIFLTVFLKILRKTGLFEGSFFPGMRVN